jgi:hypothetical protein
MHLQCCNDLDSFELEGSIFHSYVTSTLLNKNSGSAAGYNYKRHVLHALHAVIGEECQVHAD